ncbi:MAG: hypothetical protein WDM76_16815 [Limisphaerales bacterium]
MGPAEPPWFPSAAQLVLPPKKRTDRLANALLDDLEGRSQVGPNTFKGFYKIGKAGEILLNVANGVVAVTIEGIKLLPHGPGLRFYKQMALIMRHWHPPSLSKAEYVIIDVLCKKSEN